MSFKDHFSAHADEYARRRPGYPPELFEWLASVAPANDLAWDCGTGNGQAAVGLAAYFNHVIATDPSADQLRNAFHHPHVEYRLAPAESSGLDSVSLDLVTVAQAIHWFDLDLFYREVHRTLKPGGVLAAWAYALCRVTPEIDSAIDTFYWETVGPYWPSERKLVDEGYRTIAFPFEEIEPPQFNIELDWTLEDMLGYLRTWSPVRRYIEAHGIDPADLLQPELASAWGSTDEVRQVTFPIFMRIGRSAR